MKTIGTIIVSFISLFLIWININLHIENYSAEEQKRDIILQLNFLEHELKNDNLGNKMQEVFPEGYLFIHALYGLAWCELALADKHDSVLKKRAIKEALYAFNRINSDTAKWNFEEYTEPAYGIFYNGWRNYLLSKILLTDMSFSGHEALIDTFKFQSDKIVTALQNSGTPFLETYGDQSWPADMCVAMASLSNHDKVFKPEYKAVINYWLQQINERKDPATGMIPHKVDPETGKSINGARGCSMALAIRLLAEINPEFMKKQFNLFEEKFISKTFGLPSVREYPKGVHESGDIDSGPVILGVGFSATITMIGTYSVVNKPELALQQYKTINAFGFHQRNKNRKRYLFGKLPIADAFIAWGRATCLNNYQHSPSKKNHSQMIGFHCYTLLFLGLCWILISWKRLKF